MKRRNLVYDRLMVRISSYLIGNVIKVNIQKDQIIQQVVTKFGILEVDNGGDTMTCSDDNVLSYTYSNMMKLSPLYIVIRTYHCVTTVINFQNTKFGHNLLYDPISLNINFNHLYHYQYHYHHYPSPFGLFLNPLNLHKSRFIVDSYQICRLSRFNAY